MSVLAEGSKLTVHVIKVEENFDSYTNTKTAGGGLMYCHKTYFRLDDDEEFIGQLCVEHNYAPFKDGDAIAIQVGKFTRGIYNLKLESVIPYKAKINVGNPAEFGLTTKLAPPILHIAGTPGAISLTMATTYHANRAASTPEDILATAEKFKQYLLDNTN